jgi:hypothetical protein
VAPPAVAAASVAATRPAVPVEVRRSGCRGASGQIRGHGGARTRRTPRPERRDVQGLEEHRAATRVLQSELGRLRRAGRRSDDDAVGRRGQRADARVRRSTVRPRDLRRDCRPHRCSPRPASRRLQPPRPTSAAPSPQPTPSARTATTPAATPVSRRPSIRAQAGRWPRHPRRLAPVGDVEIPGGDVLRRRPADRSGPRPPGAPRPVDRPPPPAGIAGASTSSPALYSTTNRYPFSAPPNAGPLLSSAPSGSGCAEVVDRALPVLVREGAHRVADAAIGGGDLVRDRSPRWGSRRSARTVRASDWGAVVAAGHHVEEDSRPGGDAGQRREPRESTPAARRECCRRPPCRSPARKDGRCCARPGRTRLRMPSP